MKPFPSNLNIAIADDHAILREGIKTILAPHPEVQIVIEAANGKELLQKIAEGQPAMPDICLLDISMPVMNGYETLIALKKEWPAIRVLVISMFEEELTILKMLQQGANGYLSKSNAARELFDALRHLYHTGFYHSDLVANSLYRSLKYNGKDIVAAISSKDLSFLSFCCTDMTYSQIARKMNVSTSTAEKWRDALFEKFNVHTRIGLAVFSITSGLFYLQNPL